MALDEATIQQRGRELAAAHTDIVSPVTGTAVSRNATMGKTQDDTNVGESDIGAIKEGEVARFTVDALLNRVLQGSVAQVRQSPQTVTEPSDL